MPCNLKQQAVPPAAARTTPGWDVSQRSRHTELLLNCARIGYNP
jgi:hypothetical protein